MVENEKYVTETLVKLEIWMSKYWSSFRTNTNIIFIDEHILLIIVCSRLIRRAKCQLWLTLSLTMLWRRWTNWGQHRSTATAIHQCWMCCCHNLAMRSSRFRRAARTRRHTKMAVNLNVFLNYINRYLAIYLMEMII